MIFQHVIEDPEINWPPLWSSANIAVSHSAGPGSFPGRVSFPGWGFIRGLSSTVKLISVKLGRIHSRLSLAIIILINHFHRAVKWKPNTCHKTHTSQIWQLCCYVSILPFVGYRYGQRFRRVRFVNERFKASFLPMWHMADINNHFVSDCTRGADRGKQGEMHMLNS